MTQANVHFSKFAEQLFHDIYTKATINRLFSHKLIIIKMLLIRM